MGDLSKEPFENQLFGMNRLLLALSVLLFSTVATAQQDPQLTQFYQDRLSFNPAFAGAERLQYVNAFYPTSGEASTSTRRPPRPVQRQARVHPRQRPSSSGRARPGAEHRRQTGLRLPQDHCQRILSVGVAANYMGKTLGNDWITR